MAGNQYTDLLTLHVRYVFRLNLGNHLESNGRVTKLDGVVVAHSKCGNWVQRTRAMNILTAGRLKACAA